MTFKELFYNTSITDAMSLLDMSTLMTWRRSVPGKFCFYALPVGIPFTAYYKITRSRKGNIRAKLDLTSVDVLNLKGHCGLLDTQGVQTTELTVDKCKNLLMNELPSTLLVFENELPEKADYLSVKCVLTTYASEPVKKGRINLWPADNPDGSSNSIYVEGGDMIEHPSTLKSIRKTPVLYQYDVMAHNASGKVLVKKMVRTIPFIRLDPFNKKQETPLFNSGIGPTTSAYRCSLFFSIDAVSLHQINNYLDKYRMRKYKGRYVMESMGVGRALYGARLFLKCHTEYQDNVRSIPNG